VPAGRKKAARPPTAPPIPFPEAAGGPDPRAIAAALVPWFEKTSRDLPWRRIRTGYRTWVSEIMLQQTRVSTVIPYFERFLARFPGPKELASAEIGEVLSLWSGLGYYRRARGLHEGAQDVVSRFGGEVPPTAEQLLTIKGVGPYTAGAIASLAFGQQTPIVDGNVIRVIARLWAIEDDARQGATQKRIWKLAGDLVPAEKPGVFNEAMMELGAMVCTPRDPLCLLCPLAAHCVGRARGIAARLPLLSAKKAPTEVAAAALLARQDGAVLLGRRRSDALFGGLWEPPMIEAPSEAEARLALARLAAPDLEDLGPVEHTLSHRRMTIAVLAGHPAPGAVYPPVYEEVRFVAESDLGQYGISTLARKIMARVPARAKAPAKAPRPKREQTSAPKAAAKTAAKAGQQTSLLEDRAPAAKAGQQTSLLADEGPAAGQQTSLLGDLAGEKKRTKRRPPGRASLAPSAQIGAPSAQVGQRVVEGLGPGVVAGGVREEAGRLGGREAPEPTSTGTGPAGTIHP
jgi:A/G-specific adenine glycosylase